METNVDFFDAKDVVEKFLTANLSEIRSKRQNLEEQLSRRKEVLDDILRKGASESLGRSIAVGNMWKMIVNEKYVVGINVSNIGTE